MGYTGVSGMSGRSAILFVQGMFGEILEGLGFWMDEGFVPRGLGAGRAGI
jgi:hypothetical protein